jgi:hypothetical protein
MVIVRIATLKIHIELLVPGQIWDRIRDPEPWANSGLDTTSRIFENDFFLNMNIFGWWPGRVQQTHSIPIRIGSHVCNIILKYYTRVQYLAETVSLITISRYFYTIDSIILPPYPALVDPNDKLSHTIG